MKNSERFSALYYRDFRLFWAAQLISFTGTWMHSVAQGWLVYSLTKSPLYLGIVSAASSLPVLLLTLLGGVIADRFPKRNLLLLTQALSMLPALLIGILSSMGIVTVWHVILLVTCLGVVNAFDVPARQSFLVELVEKGNLLNAIALNSAAFNAARIFGPVIAGITIAHLGVPACFYLNALSFVPVVGVLWMMKAKGEIIVGKASFLQEFKEGMRFVRDDKEVFRIMLLVAVFSLFGLPFIAMMPIFAVEVLNAGVKGFGYLAASAGIGAFIAAVSLASRGNTKASHGFIAFTSALFPVGLFFFSLSKTYWLSILLLVVIGWAVVSFLALANSRVQIKSPDSLRGRVMSVYTLVFLGFGPIGNSITGVLAELLGTANAITLNSVVCLAVSMAVMFGRRQ